jgi:hypothetical protein
MEVPTNGYHGRSGTCLPQAGLIVTMDNATNEHYDMFFVDQEGTASSSCLPQAGSWGEDGYRI